MRHRRSTAMSPSVVSDESDPCFDLLCGEDAGALADYDCLAEYPTKDPDQLLFPDDSDESIAEFLEGESDYSPGFDYPARFRSKSLDPFARQESVAWILKVGWGQGCMLDYRYHQFLICAFWFAIFILFFIIIW